MFIYLFIYVIQENGQHTNVKTNYAERNSKCISDWRGVEITTEEEEWKKITKNKVTLKKKIHKAKKSVCSVDVEISLDKKLKKEEKHYPHDGALELQCLCVVYTDSRDTHTHTQLKTRERFPCFSCFLMRPQLPSGAESAPWPPPDPHTDTLNNFWRTL